ncbi:hypothetical protein HOA55_05025 [archaeon]|jgi:hypothetical protein|nr:hypothetical protein [archaeon]MBT3578143.1 hypothetical protein [archaeon]MBT6820691.1 hypothetical protein [archaeon]MBT6955881.1 hypothetical protein [archaeon]MBT7024899.1 hypothetical protein [archaeon]
MKSSTFWIIYFVIAFLVVILLAIWVFTACSADYSWWSGIHSCSYGGGSSVGTVYDWWGSGLREASAGISG